MDSLVTPAGFPAGGKAEIGMLTGLRGVAALCVLLAHAWISDVQFSGPVPLWVSLFGSGGYLGMSIFFVLSGFVIHYNYGAKIAAAPLRGIWNFFVARFARLYPLYFTVTVLTLFYWGYFYNSLLGDENTKALLHEALPYYAFLAQSWFFHPIDGGQLIGHFPALMQVSWSISTEWLLYCMYPILLIGLIRLRTSRAAFIAMLALVAAGWTVIACASGFWPRMIAFGVEHFGTAGTRSDIFGFFGWLFYLSPYARVFEFLMGCLAAAIFMRLRETTISPREARWGRAGAIASLGALVLVYGYLYFPHHDETASESVARFFFSGAFPVAALIFCCARYGGALARALTWRPIMVCGEASYSIYLLHVIVVDYVRIFDQNLIPNPPPVNAFFVGQALLRVAIVSLLVISLSLVVYRFLEIPARRALRRRLSVVQPSA